MSESQFLTVDDADLESPRRYYDRLLRECPEHGHLEDGEATVDFLFRVEPLIRGGKLELGSVHLPNVQGKLKGVFDFLFRRVFGRIPNFVMILDLEYWRDASEREREILVYHEMCHAEHKTDKEGELRFDEAGKAVYGIREHDVNEFIAVVERYGQWSDEIRRFVRAAGGVE